MKIYKVIERPIASRFLEVVSKMQWDVGQARTKELTGTVKHNKEILYDSNKEAKAMLGAIGKSLKSHQGVSLDCIPLAIHTPKFNKFSEGDHYNLHTDAPWMGSTRTDLSCTVFLSDPSEYEGGELIVGGKKVKANPGEAVIYECGSPHEVTPVTKGERICAVTWMQSRIRDHAKRKIISDFRRWLAKMQKHPDLFFEGNVIYSSLLRRWMES